MMLLSKFIFALTFRICNKIVYISLENRIFTDKIEWTTNLYVLDFIFVANSK